MPSLISDSVEYQLPSPRPPISRVPTAFTSSMLPGFTPFTTPSLPTVGPGCGLAAGGVGLSLLDGVPAEVGAAGGVVGFDVGSEAGGVPGTGFVWGTGVVCTGPCVPSGPGVVGVCCAYNGAAARQMPAKANSRRLFLAKNPILPPQAHFRKLCGLVCNIEVDLFLVKSQPTSPSRTNHFRKC